MDDKELKAICNKLDRFIKEEIPQTDLILSDTERPANLFLHKTVLPTCPDSFFKESNDTRVDYDYVSGIYLMDYQIKNPKACLGEKRPFALDFSIPPLYGTKDILYAKEGAFLYRISLDRKNPCFQIVNLKTGEISPLSLPKTLEIAKQWADKDEAIAQKLCQELTTLFKKTPKERRITPKKRQTLPLFDDVYRFYGLKECVEKEAKQLVLLNTYFNIKPTLCAGKQVMMKKGDIYYKIALGSKMKFERISPVGHSLLTPQDLSLMVTEMNQAKTFGEKTPIITQIISHIYNHAVAKTLDTSRKSAIIAPPAPDTSFVTTLLNKTKSSIK